MIFTSLVDSEVASLRSVYYKSNIELPVESRFSQQLLTKREGHVTVKLQVSVVKKISDWRLQQIQDNMPLSDDAHIQVIMSTDRSVLDLDNFGFDSLI